MCAQSDAPDGAREELESNGYSVMVSAEGHGLVNERVSYHRAVLGVLRDAQTRRNRPHKSVQTLKCVLNRMHQTVRRKEELESNGYSVMVSAEGHSLVI